MKLIALTIIAALSLQACATSTTCSSSEIQSMKDENASLLASRAEIVGFQNGQPIPGIAFSSLSRADLIAAYQTSYNRALDRLIARSQKCT